MPYIDYYKMLKLLADGSSSDGGPAGDAGRALNYDFTYIADFIDGLYQYKLQELTDPTLEANSGFVYAKDVTGQAELFYMDDVSPTPNTIQITSDGELKLTGLTKSITTTGTLQAGKLEIDDASTYIDKDGSNNMTFTDAVTGTRTLKNIGCPVYLLIKATGQAEDTDLHLSASTWNVDKALIKTIRIITSSTDWDLYVLQDSSGYGSYTGNIPILQIGFNENGDADILLDYPYEDEDATQKVHLYFHDNSGANTADIYIIGTELI